MERNRKEECISIILCLMLLFNPTFGTFQNIFANCQCDHCSANQDAYIGHAFLVSTIDCARNCAQLKTCRYFTSFSKDSELWCQLSSSIPTSLKTQAQCSPASHGHDPSYYYKLEIGTSTVEIGISTVETGTSTVETGTSTVETGTSTVETSTSTVETGTSTVETGTSTVETGTSTVETGTSTVETGTSTERDELATSDTECSPVQIENRWSRSWHEDQNSNLKNSTWVLYLDTNDSETQTFNNLKTQVGTSEGKMVFEDAPSGLIYVLVVNWVYSSNKKVAVTTTYIMEQNDEGFKENASQIVYTSTSTGKLNRLTIYTNGSSNITDESTSILRVFTHGPSEYSLSLSAILENVNSLREALELGYKMHGFKVVLMKDGGANVTYYNTHERVHIAVSTAKPIIPLKYYIDINSFYLGGYRYLKTMGSPSVLNPGRRNTKDPKTTPVSVRLSPHWRIASDPSHEECLQAYQIGRLIVQGHVFRVSFREEIFDVDALTRIGNETYFSLPQQLKAPSIGYLDEITVGIRAAVSLQGLLSWCSHPLESEDVLEASSIDGFQLKVFVDQKVRSAALSVFSNGSVAFGSAAEVADAAKVGKDVNVLIEWLNVDMARQFTVDMVSIKADGQPDVLVTAESKVSWKLIWTPEGDMVVNPNCDMEKVLVKSNGVVQILSYNVHSRRRVAKIVDVCITWFTS